MNRREQEFQPEGFRPAWFRWTRNLRIIRDRDDKYPAAWRRTAWRDLSHSYVNWHVEGVRAFLPEPKWLPKWTGKGIIAIEIGAIVALIAWPILVVT